MFFLLLQGFGKAAVIVVDFDFGKSADKQFEPKPPVGSGRNPVDGAGPAVDFFDNIYRIADGLIVDNVIALRISNLSGWS